MWTVAARREGDTITVLIASGGLGMREVGKTPADNTRRYARLLRKAAKLAREENEKGEP